MIVAQGVLQKVGATWSLLGAAVALTKGKSTWCNTV